VPHNETASFRSDHPERKEAAVAAKPLRDRRVGILDELLKLDREPVTRWR